MNRIYKVIWSKVKHQYIVVSELAHSCTKSTSKQAGRSAAAVLAVLALTTGVGVVPAEAATNSEWTAETDAKGNYTAYLDEENTVGTSSENNLIVGDSNSVTNSNNHIFGNKNALGTLAKDNYIIGDGNAVKKFEDAWVLGNNNQLYTESTGSWVSYHSMVIGSSNTIARKFDNSIILGNNNSLSGNATDVLIFGSDMQLGDTKDESILIGNGIQAGVSGNSITGSVVIGDEATNESPYSVVLGAHATMGKDAQSSGRGVVIGSYAEIDESTSNSIAIGSGGQDEHTRVGVDSDHSIAMGYNAQVSDSVDHSVAIGGVDAYIGTGSNFGTLIGSYARIEENAEYATAFGYRAEVSSGSGTSIGSGAAVRSKYSIAIGGGWDVADNNERTEVETGATEAIALGHQARVHEDAEHSIAAGAQASVAENAGDSIAIGYSAKVLAKETGDPTNKASAVGVQSQVKGSQASAFGYGSKALAQYATAVGGSAEAKSYASVAVGPNAKIDDKSTYSSALGYRSEVKTGTESTAIGGRESIVSSNYGTALGSHTTVSAIRGTALGYNASIAFQNNIALGADSRDTITEGGTDVYIGGYKDKSEGELVSTASNWDKDNEWLWGQQVHVGDFAGWQAAGGTVSVGYNGFERTITNVAAGRISADSTDAINGSQLYHVTGNLQTQIDELKENDHYHTVNGNDKETSSTAGGNTGAAGNVDSSSGNETVGNATQGQAGPVAGNGDAAGGTNTDPVGDKPDLGGGYVPEGGDGNLLIKWDTDAQGNKYYDISLNKDLSIDNIHVNEEITVGDSVSITDEHINIGDVNISKDKITVGDNVTINDDSVKVGDITINENNIDMNNHKIVNVAEGTAGTDAVNVNQLNRLEQNITNQVTNLNGKVNRLDDKINKVGAGAAALAALHPLDFDPDDKLSFSAGIGHYKDSTAAAIGAFYQPNDDTLFSIGGTIGNGEEMVNAGVSIRFGQHSHQSRSKKAMAKEIIELRAEMAELKAMVNGITGQGFDIYKSEIFPDTPETHWAYDYVAAVAGNGILEGYPSGRFDGSRLMTRYEMAAVIYRLMTQGVQVDQRMVDEFAPELARIKVDTLTHYNDGTPHIQRVRVIEGRG